MELPLVKFASKVTVYDAPPAVMVASKVASTGTVILDHFDGSHQLPLDALSHVDVVAAAALPARTAMAAPAAWVRRARARRRLDGITLVPLKVPVGRNGLSLTHLRTTQS
jgi:hypothetical protein